MKNFGGEFNKSDTGLLIACSPLSPRWDPESFKGCPTFCKCYVEQPSHFAVFSQALAYFCIVETVLRSAE